MENEQNDAAEMIAKIIEALPFQARCKKPDQIMNWIVEQIQEKEVFLSWRFDDPGDWIWADLAIEIWLLRRMDIGSIAKRRLKTVLDNVRELSACKLKKAGAR